MCVQEFARCRLLTQVLGNRVEAGSCEMHRLRRPETFLHSGVGAIKISGFVFVSTPYDMLHTATSCATCMEGKRADYWGGWRSVLNADLRSGQTVTSGIARRCILPAPLVGDVTAGAWLSSPCRPSAGLSVTVLRVRRMILVATIA